MVFVYSALMLLLILAPLPVKADMVLQWNEYALGAIRADATPPPVASRALAITQAAVFDSVNSIYPLYNPYKFQVPGYNNLWDRVKPVVAAAAVAAAGYTSLAELFPSQSANLQSKYLESLGGISGNQWAKAIGVNLGTKVANDMLDLRKNDGWNVPLSPPYTPTDPPVPGRWQPTPPKNDPFLLPQWGDVTPFTMKSNEQFSHQPPPPNLKSAKYAKEFNEVKSLGAATSTTRTADQTNIAYFWADGPTTETPPGHWNSIAQTVAPQNNTLVENARLFALLNLAEADAGITAWNMKLKYDFWRPITAIREADIDGNKKTTADPTWEPLLTTPPFPGYVSGHSTFSAAGAAVFAELFGDNVAFSSTSDGSGATRNFTSFSQAALEAGKSRIYGGIHFECDNKFGLKAGEALGEYVFDNFLTPLETAKIFAGDLMMEPLALTNGQLVTTPLPGTLAMSLTGIGAMLLAAWRRRR